jgi:NTP pyrophosphatase (non-canonical NTP hydrolase)
MSDMYDDLLSVKGYQFQIGIANEEMGELISKLNKYLRGRITADDVCEEIADVEVSFKSLKRYFGEKSVAEQFVKKEERLYRRVQKYKNIKGR